MTGPGVITATSMRQLLAEGRARPLLDGHFPVPVQLDGQWWHVPAHPGPGAAATADFVPAPAALAAEFERLAARRRAADAALRRPGRAEPS